MWKKLAILAGIFLFLIPFTVKAQQCNQETCWNVTQNLGDSYSISDNNTLGTTICLFYAGLGTVQVSDENGNGASIDEAPDGSFCYTNAFGGKDISFYNIFGGGGLIFPIKPPSRTTYLEAIWNDNNLFCRIIGIIENMNSSNSQNIINTNAATQILQQQISTISQKASMTIGGTEYQIGEQATVFLQLKDGQGNAINNGSCLLDIYYPNQPNVTHGVFIIDAPIIYKNNSDGIYFYDLVAPNITGVYMLSATCSYPYQNNWLYPPYDIRFPNMTIIQGVYDGSAASLNDFEDGTYMRCISDTPLPQSCIATYDFDSTGISNITSIQIYYAGESTDKSKLQMSIWNWSSSSWIDLPNILTFNGRATSATPSLINDFLSNSAPVNGTINTSNIIRIRLLGNFSGTFRQFDNWLSLRLITREGQIQDLKGSGELHISNTLSNLTVKINSTDLNSILSAIVSVNQTLNTTAMNYLIQINGTVFQINQSLYNDYLSLLTAINSVNATANQSISLLAGLNQSLFSLNQSELSHFQSLLAFLTSINYTINTTTLNFLTYINGTTYQINQSQLSNYLSLLGTINSVNSTLNTTIIQYLVSINGTTYNLSVNEANHFISILQAINSVNFTANTTLENKIDYLNNTIIPLLNEINATGNTTLTFVASINQSLLNDYLSLFQFLSEINFSLNNTLELKLDQINGTVTQINGTLPEILQFLASINTTANTTLYNQLVTINGNVLDLNSSEFSHFQQMLVLLQDINFSVNNTLENKLDFINHTTWQSWILLQNLTVGNITVMASVNWTEGLPFIWNATGQNQINYTLLGLSNEGIQLVVETLTCVSNTTLMHTLNVTNCVLGQCLDNVKNISETCANGCANNMCVPIAPIQYGLAIAAVMMISGFLFLGYRALRKGR
jgi:hypothetical protein